MKSEEIEKTKEVIEESKAFVDETDHFKIEISASFKEESESKKIDRSSTPVMVEDITEEIAEEMEAEEAIVVAEGGVNVENMAEDSDEELALPSLPVEVQNIANTTEEEDIESVTSVDEVEELEDVDAYFWFSYEFNKVEKNEFFRCHEWCTHSIEERRSYTGSAQYCIYLLRDCLISSLLRRYYVIKLVVRIGLSDYVIRTLRNHSVVNYANIITLNINNVTISSLQIITSNNGDNTL